MLKIREGKITYADNIILENINLDIKTNQLTVIIGPNGSGKTSLIKVLANDKPLNSGKMESDYKKSILIPQLPFYPQGITLFDYVSSIFFEKGWKWSLAKEDIDQTLGILERLNLEPKKEQMMHQLSGGELQLANIALCLISGADFILLDEPSANLDLLNQITILEILKKLTTKNITVVAILHDINLASKYGDKFIILYKDKSLLYGDKLEVFCKDSLCKSYEVNFKVHTLDEDTFIQPDI
jgi:iron complex transport system ATP-binding protein